MQFVYGLKVPISDFKLVKYGTNITGYAECPKTKESVNFILYSLLHKSTFCFL